MILENGCLNYKSRVMDYCVGLVVWPPPSSDLDPLMQNTVPELCWPWKGHGKATCYQSSRMGPIICKLQAAGDLARAGTSLKGSQGPNCLCSGPADTGEPPPPPASAISAGGVPTSSLPGSSMLQTASYNALTAHVIVRVNAADNS